MYSEETGSSDVIPSQDQIGPYLTVIPAKWVYNTNHEYSLLNVLVQVLLQHLQSSGYSWLGGAERGEMRVRVSMTATYCSPGRQFVELNLSRYEVSGELCVCSRASSTTAVHITMTTAESEEQSALHKLTICFLR